VLNQPISNSRVKYKSCASIHGMMRVL
jgi:hypothetical protein